MTGEMQRLADLGAALRPQDIPLDRLRAKAAATTAEGGRAATHPRRSWTAPSLVAASVVVLATAAVLVAGAIGDRGTGGGSGVTAVDTAPGTVAARPASFTVAKNADGSVTFTVHDLLDLSGATAALNAAGIAGRVLTSTADCTTGPNVVPIDPADVIDHTYRGGGGDGMTGDETVTISSSVYPPGGGVLVTVGGGYHPRGGPLRLIVAYIAYLDADKIPECVNLLDPGTGELRPWPPQPN